jgi:hypothetical protein
MVHGYGELPDSETFEKEVSPLFSLYACFNYDTVWGLEPAT